MQIHHQAQASAGQFFIHDAQQQPIATLDYVWHGQTYLSIDHTWVDPKYRGQQLAQQLISAVVDYARAQQLHILPTCSYAQIIMRRNAEFAALIYSPA
jgi:predicted GNAT family acetyltransferase